MRQAPKRRHGIGATKRRAAITLFCSGLHPRQVGRLLGVTPDEVLNALRRKVARR